MSINYTYKDGVHIYEMTDGRWLSVIQSIRFIPIEYAKKQPEIDIKLMQATGKPID